MLPLAIHSCGLTLVITLYEILNSNSPFSNPLSHSVLTAPFLFLDLAETHFSPAQPPFVLSPTPSNFSCHRLSPLHARLKRAATLLSLHSQPSVT